MKTGTLTTPDAEIHYEVRGSGPPLLLVNGGDGDAAMYGPLAGHLAEDFTVITYDLRGNSRSRLTSPPREQRIEEHGQDALLLLDAVAAGEPAYVFGTSYGGMIGMALLARHPGRVRALVAHEPFVIDLLPDADRWHALFQEVYELYEREGLDAAMGRFCGAIGMEAPPEPTGACRRRCRRCWPASAATWERAWPTSCARSSASGRMPMPCVRRGSPWCSAARDRRRSCSARHGPSRSMSAPGSRSSRAGTWGI